MTRRLHWPLVAALVLLAGRALAYALVPSPTPLSAELARNVGGPRLLVTTLVALGAALAVASALLWVAGLAVRERHLLSGLAQAPPPLRPLRVLRAALLLWIATSLAFASLESYVHWRAGLGLHGLHCLTGPVHRNALPLLGALSLLAAAVEAAVRHLLRWMRRTIAALRARPRLHRHPARPTRLRSDVPLRTLLRGAGGPRGPPAATPA
jgi:hypothetical protein